MKSSLGFAFCTVFLLIGSTEPVVRGNPSAIRDVQQPSSVAVEKDYEADVSKLLSLRSSSLEDVVAFANRLEKKWRQINLNRYARIMNRVCSEIINRGINDSRLRGQSERFARLALSYAPQFTWENQADLVGALGYVRSSSKEKDWIVERRMKTVEWLKAWRRLENELDPTFDVNDRTQLPAVRVLPPYETGLPPGTPPSAIRDAKLRAQYETALAVNKKKADRVNQQLPLVARGSTYKARAQHALIQMYSQGPDGLSELRQYLGVYIKDRAAQNAIVEAVTQATQSRQ